MIVCKACGNEFSTTEAEREFRTNMKLPLEPKLCPACRRQRRLAFRNERRLYYRLCDDSGKRLIAVYPENPEHKVVCFDQTHWWDYEKMDPLSFGQDFDFSRPFFDQFAELKAKVPHPNLHNTNVENALYGNHCVSNKDCYLTIGSDLCRDCYYTYWAIRCTDCFDCSVAYDCEVCHSCVDVRLCYNCYHVVNSENLIDSQYCYDCKGCHDCFGCVGLRHQEYHILNEKLSETEYRLRVKRLRTDPEAMDNFLIRYERLRRSFIQLAAKNLQSEEVVGDRLWRSRQCYQSFDLEKCERTNYSTFGFEGISCQDIDFFGRAEKMYEGFSAFGQYNCISTILCHYSFDTYYSEYCISCHHLFGCVSLHHHNYCILNKQYERSEWEELVSRIIEHMVDTGEWGEFFPVELSSFPYNVTVAQKYFPLSKEEIEERGWAFEPENVVQQEQRYNSPTPLKSLPEDDSEVDSSICKEVLACERTGRPYQIMPREYKYLRDRGLPLPRIHHDERNALRMTMRNPQQLWDHTCTKCGERVASSFDPSLGYKVYCEGCYGLQNYTE